MPPAVKIKIFAGYIKAEKADSPPWLRRGQTIGGTDENTMQIFVKNLTGRQLEIDMAEPASFHSVAGSPKDRSVLPLKRPR